MPSLPRKFRSQRGVILLFLLIGLALVMIAMSAGALRFAQQIKRDREEEMIHRGVQYARAIQKYYKKFGRYPSTLEQLENTNNIRFLRKKYKDPMTKDGKWRLVRYGEVQTGQAGGLLGVGGNLPPVVGGALGSPDIGQPSTPVPQQQQSPNQSTGSPSSSFGQPIGSAFGQGSNQPSAFGSQSMGGTGQFGGGAIMGVASLSEAQGIRAFDNKSKYKQWLFIYDPTLDRGTLINGPYNPKAFVGQPNQVGTPAGQIGQPQPGGVFGNNPAPGQSSPAPSNTPQQNPQ